MGPFEAQVEESVAGQLTEAPKSGGKPSYWRTVDSGHKVGFKGRPGSGTPVTGHPKLKAKLKKKGKGKAAPKKGGKKSSTKGKLKKKVRR